MGYRIDDRDTFNAEASQVLKDRVEGVDGSLVLWDPEDDGEGFMIVGDRREILKAEKAKAEADPTLSFTNPKIPGF